MNTYRNIGSSDYVRSNGQRVKSGHCFTVSTDKEQSMIDHEHSVGIRLLEVDPAVAAKEQGESTPQPEQRSTAESTEEDTGDEEKTDEHVEAKREAPAPAPKQQERKATPKRRAVSRRR